MGGKGTGDCLAGVCVVGKARPGDTDERDQELGCLVAGGGLEPGLYGLVTWTGTGTGVFLLGALACFFATSVPVFCFFADLSVLGFLLLPDGVSLRLGAEAVAVGPFSPSSMCLRFFSELASGTLVVAAATLVPAFLEGGAVIVGLGLETPKGVYRARRPSG